MRKQFNMWKKKFHKKYATEEHDEYNYNMYRENNFRIEQLQKRGKVADHGVDSDEPHGNCDTADSQIRGISEDNEEMRKQWKEWKNEFNPIYKCPEDEQFHYFNFRENVFWTKELRRRGRFAVLIDWSDRSIVELECTMRPDNHDPTRGERCRKWKESIPECARLVRRKWKRSQ